MDNDSGLGGWHTPGPWLYRHLHGKDEFAVFWHDSAFANRERQSRLDNRCGEFKEADARLIAAAPDLLSALANLLLAASKRDPQPWRDAQQDAVAAIAKATGSAS